ncbi:hypothetical protein AWE51_14435 [Aquimarina aggregata]|uniref:Uncharacterized protein n=1 Tax=Aquimarina aggregata TaxID=1642818 RepID=A0A162Y6X8_9FLAO|nr:hypothetical protein AWE51_14435 [Aquimarina aggregata]
MPAQTINDVIVILEDIIIQSKTDNNPLGYFAALYRKVTIKVKEGIENDFFDDGPRMEKLDVIFANRYLEAYFAYQEDKEITMSWTKAFTLSKMYWPIVLQHLLVGINAHINLDLGIAAAQISNRSTIEDLKGDFDKINDILSSLVNEVENDLAEIWPTLKKILKLTRKADDFLVDFSMKLARDGAWDFAVKMANTIDENIPELIKERDYKAAKKGNIIDAPGLAVKIILMIVRLGERGTVKDKINTLNLKIVTF